MPAPSEIQAGALSHDRPCCYCLHAAHAMRCLEDLGHGAFCPCRDVPVPGLLPDLMET